MKEKPDIAKEMLAETRERIDSLEQLLETLKKRRDAVVANAEREARQ
jgi:BMFP domain-containing protein YqiC